MGGGQFDKPNFILIIRKKIIPSQKLFMFKEFFVPGGFSARDYGIVAVCSLSVVCLWQP